MANRHGAAFDGPIDYSAPCFTMSRAKRLTHLPSQAIYLCLQQLVSSMQEEQEESHPVAGESPKSPPVGTELWREVDVDAFIDALHSIKARAPNGGFKAAHFQEAFQILSKKVPDGMPKTVEQLSSKYQEVSFFFNY